jgi:hypothetical protein
LIASTAATTWSIVSNANKPPPVGMMWLNPVSWAMTGFAARVTDVALAEPAAAHPHVLVFRDGELGSRLAEVRRVFAEDVE